MIIANDHFSKIKNWESKIFFMTTFSLMNSNKQMTTFLKFVFDETSLFYFRRTFLLNRSRQVFTVNKFFCFERFSWFEMILVICILTYDWYFNRSRIKCHEKVQNRFYFFLVNREMFYVKIFFFLFSHSL
jgi:hypothetical protein